MFGVTIDQVKLNFHIESVHKMGGKKFICEKCPYTSDHKVNLNKHTITVHGERKFICSDCGFAFVQNVHLKKHIKEVHAVNKEKFMCDLCPYTSALKANWNTGWGWWFGSGLG